MKMKAEQVILSKLFAELAAVRKKEEENKYNESPFVFEREKDRIKKRINLVSGGKYYPAHGMHVKNNIYGVAVEQPQLFV